MFLISLWIISNSNGVNHHVNLSPVIFILTVGHFSIDMVCYKSIKYLTKPLGLRSNSGDLLYFFCLN